MPVINQVNGFNICSFVDDCSFLACSRACMHIGIMFIEWPVKIFQSVNVRRYIRCILRTQHESNKRQQKKMNEKKNPVKKQQQQTSDDVSACITINQIYIHADHHVVLILCMRCLWKRKTNGHCIFVNWKHLLQSKCYFGEIFLLASDTKQIHLQRQICQRKCNTGENEREGEKERGISHIFDNNINGYSNSSEDRQQVSQFRIVDATAE